MYVLVDANTTTTKEWESRTKTMRFNGKGREESVIGLFVGRLMLRQEASSCDQATHTCAAS
jgi:hypothetical protein